MKNRKIWKRLMAVIMSVTLLVPMPVVLAEEGQMAEGQQEAAVSGESRTVDKDGFVINDNGILESYAGTATKLTIPNTVKGIGRYAFYYQENIKSIIIPNTVTYIDSNAFKNCSGLEEITISNMVTRIGSGTFSDCTSLSKITIPDSVTNIGYEAFKGCIKLEEVSISDKVTKLENSLFYGCTSLVKIMIPDSVTEMESSLFSGCSNLAEITIPDSVTKIGNSVFSGCSNLEEVKLPAELTELSSNLFDGCGSLLRVNIPDTVTVIRYRAFGNCLKLAEITIPENVAEIENGAFEACGNLTNIAVAEGNSIYTGVEGILYNKEKTEIVAYPGAKENIIIPNGVTKIGSAFSGCSELKSISIPVTVTVIGNSAFLECSGLKAIEIPDSVVEIGSSAFAGCSNLTEVTIPFGVEKVESRVFTGCSSLEIVNLPNSVSVIGENAFEDCSNLKGIEFPKWLRGIEGEAFSGCSSLRSIDVPESVDQIGLRAFAGCSNLTQIKVAEENLRYMSMDGCLYNKELTALCICPEGKTEVNIPDSVTIIGNYALYDCDKLTEIKIPWSVTCIGDSAFSGCNGLTSISLSENVTDIWDFAFLACENLKTINIPSGVKKIPRWTFLNCKSLESVSIAAEEISIGDKAFHNCNSLTGISFQGEIRQIGGEVFKGCDNLTFYGKEGSNVAEHAQWEGVQFSAEEVPWTVPSDISVCQITLNPESFTYDGTAKIPKIAVYNGNVMLEENTDYTVTCENNINAGTGQAIITGIGNYTGTVTKEFTITGNQDKEIANPKAKELSACQITITPTAYIYDGTAKMPAVTIKDGTATLKTGTDYKTEYKDNIKVGTAKVIITGMGNYKGTVTKTFTIQNASQNNSNNDSQDNANGFQTDSKNLICTKTTYKKVYGNKPFSLGITLKDTKGILTCASSNKKVLTVDNKGKVTIKGTGIAVITAKVDAVGNYSAESVKITVEVSPKKQIVKSLKTAKGKKLKVSWKKDKQATGYQIQYSTDKKFKKGTKTANINKNKIISKTVSKLKAGKKYYVRVRSYKNAKINGKSKKLYGAWSSGKRSGSIKK